MPSVVRGQRASAVCADETHGRPESSESESVSEFQFESPVDRDGVSRLQSLLCQADLPVAQPRQRRAVAFASTT